ncbi:uncharacterized protein [Lepeophtheirus salmonis]|uniref:uncharacterized protein n=1 Tax=Lepeophtheirus salmonis TaxID=72036 RepID=UPI003AF3D61A
MKRKDRLFHSDQNLSGGQFCGSVGSGLAMERSVDEKLKFPDRINIDRKGLHGIPILSEEPGLRLLSLQHNMIKKIQHLDLTTRLVFLDLYRNRLENISGLEYLVNLRVLMLGKNRIRRIDGLQKCEKLSVLDLHGNRITQISGLEKLCEIKVLNLAGNMIRKITNISNLVVLEELNLRRNRVRSTSGLECVPTIEKLYISNNEIQNISSLSNLENLKNLHTVQMEGNPVWSCSEYTFHLVSSLDNLKMLDQQEITTDVRSYAEKWLRNKTDPTVSSANTPTTSVVGGGTARKQLLKKNGGTKLRQTEEDSMSISDSQADTTISTPESDDMKCSVSQKTTVENSNPPSRIMSRQTSRSSLVSSNKLQVPSNSRSSNPGSPNKLKNSKSEPENLKASNINGMLQRFLEFENRHFVLQQRFISMSKEVGTLDQNTTDFKAVTPNIRGFRSQNRKIGFFTSPESLINRNMNSSHEEICGLVSDSSSSSSTTDGSSSEDNMEEDNRTLFPSLSRSPRMKNKKVQELSSKYKLDKVEKKAIAIPRVINDKYSHMNFRKDYYNNRCVPSPSLASTTSAITSSPSYNAISPSISDTDIGTGRTSEQGRDYLIELDGDLLAVYGYQSLKFLDRPWNKNRAAKATTVQFNFVSFDELIPYLAKFRITFPNVIHFRFVETGLHCLGQLNALSGLQGITSLQIEEDGNPIILKSEWKLYAIYRLEHWGLRIINNEEITEKNIILANKMYGSLGELAVLVTPPSTMTNIIKKLDMFLPFSTKEELAFIDKNPVLKEIMVKESLQYKPSNQADAIKGKHLKLLTNLTDISHSAFHKFGRFEDEWLGILPILIKRIVTQFSDIRRYKKESLCRLQRSEILN